MKIRPDQIHEPDPFYFLLKFFQKLAFKAFYKNIQVIGRKNIPVGNPIIFTPNHQNALMDALAVLNTCGMNPVFLARADIFKKKRQAKILNFLKILPVYRLRDGSEEMLKNSVIFNKALEILENRYSICLMPEGSHGNKRRLRSLVKGSFRIALSAQEKFRERLKVKIVPVGLDYGHYQKFHQDLLIIFGQAVEVQEYLQEYTENQPRAINNLKEKLSDELRKVMIHIEDEANYDAYQELRTIYNHRMRNRLGILDKSHYHRFLADKEMIRVLESFYLEQPGEIKKLFEKVMTFAEGVKKFNLRYWIFEKNGYSWQTMAIRFLLMLMTSPLALFGWLSNYIPYNIPQRMIRNVKDPQFHSSFKFVLSFILFPAYYLVLAALAGILFRQAWISPAYIITGAAAGYFSLYYSFWYKKLAAVLRFKRFIRASDPEILNLKRLHQEIISEMNKLVEKSQERYKPENKLIFNVF